MYMKSNTISKIIRKIADKIQPATIPGKTINKKILDYFINYFGSKNKALGYLKKDRIVNTFYHQSD